ncbi:hypothetical protein SteCoe_21958 [Stentor coeruleus]|uniref:Uncharacterized protein n=1 Tax=Stentor coeruleus TaxID=5963 RepID=A0A1R2BN99_9CILI|nr:hypothetical protein SteCoe_21958 [Stentor coeruleus]
MSKHINRRIHSGYRSPNEDVEGQIDRLNHALQVVIKDIEASSCSRNPSRLSNFNTEIFTDEDANCPSIYTEDFYIPDSLEDKIEELLIRIDRNEMINEDFRSEELRKIENESYKSETLCNHDINKIRKEIWLQVKIQKDGLLEKERKNFQDKIVFLDQIKEDYEKKRLEIVIGISKLRDKEEILNQREKDIRMQRIAFDKHKMLWEQKNGVISEPFASDSVPPPTHVRASSYSIISNMFYESNPPSSRQKININVENKPKMLPVEVPEDKNISTKPELLKSLQYELKVLESKKNQKIRIDDQETYDIEMRIDSIKNKIATLRGEIAISESSKATRIINSMMVSIQKDAGRDEKFKKIEMLEHAHKKNSKIVSARLGGENSVPGNPGVKIKSLEGKINENIETTRRFLGTDITTSKGIEPGKYNIEYKKKILMDKEKELAHREALLQQTWMKIPGAKELIENVNLTLSRLTNEKSILEKERDEFEKDKIEWMKGKEKIIMNAKNV